MNGLAAKCAENLVGADSTQWTCRGCHRPVIDLDPYNLSREISPFATIGDLMGGAAIPSRWKPFSRRQWLLKLERCVRAELEAHHHFEMTVLEPTKKRMDMLNERMDMVKAGLARAR